VSLIRARARAVVRKGIAELTEVVLARFTYGHVCAASSCRQTPPVWLTSSISEPSGQGITSCISNSARATAISRQSALLAAPGIARRSHIGRQSPSTKAPSGDHRRGPTPQSASSQTTNAGMSWNLVSTSDTANVVACQQGRSGNADRSARTARSTQDLRLSLIVSRIVELPKASP
jgi:hypothetical protein